MKKELGIARCGLACCLCKENESCSGCETGQCENGWCQNRKCSLEKGVSCYECGEDCRKGLLAELKPYAFKRFIQLYGTDELINCLERNEKNGAVYHREGFKGDYDDFNTADEVIEFIRTGKK